MKIPTPKFANGMTWIVKIEELPWDDPKNTKMDFGILRLGKNQSCSLDQEMEKAILLMNGEITASWKESGSSKEIKEKVVRASLFDENPWCLHVAGNVAVAIKAGNCDVEIALVLTRNEKSFAPKLYKPADCKSELRGEGTMREMSTRVVRTIFDRSNAPKEANLVLGEVINYPGKWSSYPPHWHVQPEIYHYRFLPEQGFGFCMLGDEVVKVKHGDTVKIFGVTHPQTSAPGYAMYYLWAIRHLDGKPYGPESGTPVFDPAHAWVMKKDNEDAIWPPKKDKIKK
nr:5-deoxy-glucuronate isomerase [Candidatus Sigynarchaeota archaeon]